MKQPSRLLVLFSVILFVAVPRLVLALQVGDKAPDFTLKTDEGGELSLKAYKGKRIVLFFFPKANTPG